MRETESPKKIVGYVLTVILLPIVLLSMLLGTGCLIYPVRRPSWIDYTSVGIAFVVIPLAPFFAPKHTRLCALLIAIAQLVSYPFLLIYLALVIVCVVTGDCL